MVLVSPLIVLAVILFTIGVLMKALAYCLILDWSRAGEEIKQAL